MPLLGLGTVFTIAVFAFWFWAIYDVVTSDSTQIRNLPKVVWLVIVIALGFVLAIGPILWVLAGRPQRGAAAPSRGNDVRAERRPRRPHAPEPTVAPEPHRIVTDRRSAELDRMLEEWERSQREHGASES